MLQAPSERGWNSQLEGVGFRTHCLCRGTTQLTSQHQCEKDFGGQCVRGLAFASALAGAVILSN